jgi:hypothetical protein
MATGTRYSYTDTTSNKRAISDVVHMIDWKEAPLLRLLGFGQENVRKFKLVNWPSTTVEWLEDSMSPFTTTANEEIDNSETTIDVATNTGAYFRQGDIILIDSEQMLVVSSTASDITVATRPYGGTSATTHSTGATITILTRAMPEGATYTTGHSTVVSAVSNYTQIISQAASVSKTELAMTRYAVDDSLDYEVAKLFTDGGRAGRLAQFLQRTFYYGKKVQRTASAYGAMGGFSAYVTTNVTALAGAALQRSDIHTKIRSIRDAGGDVDVIVTGSWGVEKITAMYDGYITMTSSESRGGSAITKVQTPHGEVELVYDWMCPAGYMYFINTAKCGWLPMRPFGTTKIAEQGDYFVTDVVGEYTFVLANEKSHGLISGFSTTS